MKKVNLFAAILLLGLYGCTAKYHSEVSVVDEQETINLLKNKVEDGLINELDILSPKSFGEAVEKLDAAITASQKSRNIDAGQSLAQEGLLAIKKAKDNAEKAKQILNNTLEQRRNAYRVFANVILEEDFMILEKKLEQVGYHLETNDMDYVNRKDKELSLAYDKIKILALQKTIVERPKEAYQKALDANADKFAPNTLEKARQEMEIALKVLESEKDSFDKANEHAQNATYKARQAEGIAQIIALFKDKKLSKEDIVVWYQEQLSSAHQPFEQSLSFDKSNYEVIEDFRKHIRGLNELARTLSQSNAQSQQELEDLKEEIASRLNKEEQSRQKEQDRVKKFEEVSDLFSKDEAEVLAQEGKLIIRSYGFNFDIGKSEILPRNFPLLNKIVVAIQKFPNAKVEVQGHTDSSGSDSLNQDLSNKRAQNIKKFLVEISDISEARIFAEGFGEQKPIASNSTKDGRRKNRRIEIVIHSKSL